GGQPTVRLKLEKLDSLRPWRYLVAVSRWPTLHEIYAFPLERRLAQNAAPLGSDDQDVALRFQTAFTPRLGGRAPPELLQYNSPAPSELSADEQRWCRERLTTAGFGNIE